MGNRVESQELRRYVVRVDSEDRHPQGTGFFVAPGWVLTCAHVVKDAARVLVVPARGATEIPATVAARSAARVPGPSEFWPFPDLALIRLDAAVDHPCVLLDTRTPLDEECHAWGYAKREEIVAPTGSPASFRFEGIEGDDYVKLKAGQAAPGLSGAPLVCPGRRAVVGVMTMTRDQRDDLGGWAAPISALLTGGSGIPDDLAELGAEILRANRAAVLRDRAPWHRVLPVEGSDDVLVKPWWTFRRTRRPDPADLLLAGFGVVPYLFRDADIKAAVTWCATAEPLTVRVVPGGGGAGKTPFAVELCQHMERPDHGWVAGMWDATRGTAAGLAALPLPRLIVVDYTESEDLPALRSLLDRLRRQATDIAPARVLLLTRAGVAGSRDPIRILREDATPSVKQILDDSEVSHAASAVLDGDRRITLYRCAVEAFAEAWQISPTAVVPDLSAPGYALPLEVLFEALDQTLNDASGNSEPGTAAPGEAGAAVTRSPVERVLTHEEKYWAADCPINDPDLRRVCVGLATLAGADDHAGADALMSLLPEFCGDHATAYRQRVTGWLAVLYSGSARLNPLRPDRLGEALVGKVLRDKADGGVALLAAVLALADDQVTRCLEVLARLTVSDTSAANATAHALAQKHVDLTVRAEAQASGQPNRPGRMNLAAGLIRMYSGLIADLVLAALPDHEDQRDLSVSYERLADLAVAVGQTDEARRLFTQSLAIAEALAKAEPGNTTYQRDLSVSYERMGALAEHSQEHAQAAEWFTKALARRRGLSAREPQRIDLAQELAVCLYLVAQSDHRRLGDVERELIDLLSAFEVTGTITAKAAAILSWARE
ncbi:MAG: trypsin-like peptidase domain-containing protein [Pseudonocardiaceae bacterium]